MNGSKKLAPTIIAVVTLGILVIGSTFAYFLVDASNDFNTVSINSKFGAIGSVALSSGKNLSLNLSASDMMNKGSDVTYYATESGTPTSTETIVNIGTATVAGEGVYSCDYTLTMDDSSNSMYDTFQQMAAKSAGQIVLNINGVNYDFNESNLFSKTINGTLNYLTDDMPKNLKASLKLINQTSVDQNDLAGTDITISFNVTSFKCNALENLFDTTTFIKGSVASASGKDADSIANRIRTDYMYLEAGTYKIIVPSELTSPSTKFHVYNDTNQDSWVNGRALSSTVEDGSRVMSFTLTSPYYARFIFQSVDQSAFNLTLDNIDDYSPVLLKIS